MAKKIIQGETFIKDGNTNVESLTVNTDKSTGGIAGSIATVKKESDTDSTDVAVFVDVSKINNTDQLSAEIYALVSRVVNSVDFDGKGIIGANLVGRNNSAGNFEFVYGGFSQAENQGSGNVDFLSGNKTISEVTGTGASVINIMRAHSSDVVIDNPNTTVNNAQGMHPSVQMTNGTIGQIECLYLDLDYDNTGSLTVTGDIAYIRAENDVLPTTSGNIYFIKSNSPYPSEFAGSIKANEFIGDGYMLTNVGVYDHESTNYITYSEDLTDIYWTKTNVVVSNSPEIAPDGSFYKRITQTNDNGFHRIFSVVTVPSSELYTISCYIKKTTFDNYVTIKTTSDDNTNTVNTKNGQILINDGTISVIDFDGYIRLKQLVTQTSSTTVIAQIMQVQSNGNQSFIGDNTKYIDVFGVQLEIGHKLSGYKKTNGATATTEEGINTSWRTIQTEKLILNGKTSDDIILGDGSTTSLAGIGSKVKLLDTSTTDLQTTSTGVNDEVYIFTIPADTLAVGDILKIRFEGRDNSGDTTNKTMQLQLAGQTVNTTNFISTLYSNNERFTVETEIIITSVTGFRYSTEMKVQRNIAGMNLYGNIFDGDKSTGTFDITSDNDVTLDLNNAANGDLVIKTISIKHFKA